MLESPEGVTAPVAPSTVNVFVARVVPSHLMSYTTKLLPASSKWIFPCVVIVRLLVVALFTPVWEEPAVQSPIPQELSEAVVMIMDLVVSPDVVTVPAVTPSVVPKLELF